MNKDIVELEQVLKVASEAAGSQYSLIKGKKIMFESKLENGESIMLCTPLSKHHKSINAGWVDITLVQYELMESYDNAMIIFRLEGQKLSMVNWIDLKPLLIESCMRYTENSKEHWKFNIHDDYIKVSGNDAVLENEAFIYTG